MKCAVPLLWEIISWQVMEILSLFASGCPICLWVGVFKFPSVDVCPWLPSGRCLVWEFLRAVAHSIVYCQRFIFKVLQYFCLLILSFGSIHLEYHSGNRSNWSVWTVDKVTSSRLSEIATTLWIYSADIVTLRQFSLR